MNSLERKIIEKIRNEGPLTFEVFMDMALYDPESGYYAGEKMRIGREGDFYTVSHLHPFFGAMIGKQFEEMWECIGRPQRFTVVEMGPGAGYICRDVLAFLKDREIFASIEYMLVERNPMMSNRQRELIPEFPGKVAWVSSLDEVRDIIGCIFSNELLDAFPVHIVRMDEQLREIYVTARDSQLVEEAGPLSTDDILAYFGGMAPPFCKGYRTEVTLRIRDWLNDVNGSIKEGFVFTVDYGYSARDYYSDDRNRGTLLCYHRHQMNENPYQHIGEQDITAHVNFSAVNKWGEEAGFRTLGFCSQGAFLVSMGIDEAIAALDTGSKDYLFELARIKKMVLPQGMGESHMVMIQYKGSRNFPLRGFSVRNQARYL